MVHPRLVGTVILPLLERTLGRRTFRALSELERCQWYLPGQLRSLQQAKLGRLFEIAVRNCPYYADLLRGLGGVRCSGDPFEVLGSLPLLDKPTIRENLARMTNRAVAGGPIRSNTGGSTGEPLVFYVDRTRVSYDKAARLLTHNWFGVQSGDREVYLWGSPVEVRAQDRVKRWRDRLTNELLLEAFRLSPETMTDYFRRISHFDPTSVFGYPSSLTTFAEFCSAEGWRYAGRRLRAVFVTGELLDVGQRRTLEQFFGVPVADGYGSRDGGFIAHECARGFRHVMDPTHVVEIVDDQGRPAPKGTPGEIVITPLEAFALPMFRYRTGDRAALADSRCPCGRSFQILSMVEGRQTDQLVAADGTLKHALSVIYVLREVSTIGRFQVRQRSDRSVDVFVVPTRGYGAGDTEKIRIGVQRQVGGGLDVRIRLVESIDVVGSGKFRHVISEAIGRSPGREAITGGGVVAVGRDSAAV